MSSDPDAIYQSATRAELAKDYNKAFRLYINAAETFLHLNRSSQTENAAYKTSAARALERAEKIKAFVDKKKQQVLSDDIRLQPVKVDPFSQQEQYRIKRIGDVVNSTRFPLWGEPSSLIQEQPNLSPAQQENNAVWKRLESRQIFGEPGDPLLASQVVQKVVTDCSVCASVCLCISYQERFGSAGRDQPDLITMSYDCEHNTVAFKFLFNGAWRSVGVLANVLRQEHILLCMSAMHTNAPVWPSLVEKAYMTLMGGYDFPGSDTSIDIHTLSGWIPEFIEIHSPSFQQELTWERCLQGFREGNCILSLGSKTTASAIRGIQLLPSHSYAITDLREEEGRRSIYLLDSWAQADPDGPRSLDATWTEILEAFSGLYLSWNPQMWEKSAEFHGMWHIEGRESTVHLSLNFQRDGMAEGDEIWLLLTRHVYTTQQPGGYIALNVKEEQDARAHSQADLTRVAGEEAYTNRTHTLFRHRLHGSHTSGTLSIFASIDSAIKDTGFTLTAYCGHRVTISWKTGPQNIPYHEKVTINLTSRNAGGNCTLPSFMFNPQYRLRIYPPTNRPNASPVPKASVSLTLRGERDVPICMHVVWSSEERVFELLSKDIAAASGPYTYGLASIWQDFSVGTYTLILSTFRPQPSGSLALSVESSHHFDISPIPQEGSEMYTKSLRSQWTSTNSFGAPSYGRFYENATFEIDVPMSAQLKIRLQLEQPSSSIHINVTLLEAPSRKLVCNSGKYDNAVCGVVTKKTAVGPGKYWALVSAYEPSILVAFRLFVYCSVDRFRVTALN